VAVPRHGGIVRTIMKLPSPAARAHSVGPRMKRLVFVLILFVTGCASKEEIAMRRKYETQEEREHREVFYSNWLRPSVSEEDKDFYYRSFLR
jgi:hypothetical protein